MTLDWWTLALQSVNLLVLAWILARFLFRPVSQIIAERQKAAHAALDEARMARDAAEAAREAAQRELDRAASRRSELFAEAERDAQEERNRIVESAQAEASQARATSERQAAMELAERKRALDEQAVLLAADISRRLLSRLPETARVAGFIDGLTEAVAKLPEATRDHIGAEGPVALRAAVSPSKAEIELLETQISEVLGRKIHFAVSPDPTLIAGIELETPRATVRNHFRADLDRIREELITDD